MTKAGHKYHAKPVDGFASQREQKRWYELQLLERAGLIHDLRRQVKYELIPKQLGEHACHYIADAVYLDDGKQVVEDTKGVKTAAYRIKRKLMLWRYGIRIKET